MNIYVMTLCTAENSTLKTIKLLHNTVANAAGMILWSRGYEIHNLFPSCRGLVSFFIARVHNTELTRYCDDDHHHQLTP